MRWKNGSVVRIELSDEQFSFGILLEEPMIAFLELLNTGVWKNGMERDVKILFKLDVYSDVIKKNVWTKVGTAKLGDFDSTEPLRYIYQEPNDRYFLYHSSFADICYMKPCQKHETNGLEEAAVWDAHLVEERLRKELGIA